MFSFPLGMLNIHKSPLDLLLWFDSLSYAVLVEGLTRTRTYTLYKSAAWHSSTWGYILYIYENELYDPGHQFFLTRFLN